MLTEVDEERKAFEKQEQMRQHVRDHATIKARRDLIRRQKIEYLDSAAQARFERLLQSCEKDAHEIACQSAFKFDPASASNFDPFGRRVLAVALAPSELVGVAETVRARAA